MSSCVTLGKYPASPNFLPVKWNKISTFLIVLVKTYPGPCVIVTVACPSWPQMRLWAFSIVCSPYEGFSKWSVERTPALLTGPLRSPIAQAFTWASSLAQVRESQGRCYYHLCTNGETEAQRGARTCYVHLVVSDRSKQWSLDSQCWASQGTLSGPHHLGTMSGNTSTASLREQPSPVPYTAFWTPAQCQPPPESLPCHVLFYSSFSFICTFTPNLII